MSLLEKKSSRTLASRSVSINSCSRFFDELAAPVATFEAVPTSETARLQTASIILAPSIRFSRKDYFMNKMPTLTVNWLFRTWRSK